MAGHHSNLMLDRTPSGGPGSICRSPLPRRLRIERKTPQSSSLTGRTLLEVSKLSVTRQCMASTCVQSGMSPLRCAEGVEDGENSLAIATELLHLLDGLMGGHWSESSDPRSGGPRSGSALKLVNFVLSSLQRGVLKSLGFIATSDCWSEWWHSASPLSWGQTLPFVRSVLEVLLDFDLEKISSILVRTCSYSTFIGSVVSWPVADFVKNAKFFTAYPMAMFLRNPPPADPPASYGFKGSLGSGLLFRGPIRRYLKNRINSAVESDLPLFLGLLQGVKRGCAAVPDSFVLESYKSHAAAMTKENPADPEHLLSVAKYFEKVWASMAPPPDRLSEPGGSSSFGVTRSAGGGRSVLQDLLLPSGILGNQDFLYSMEEIRPGVVAEQRTGHHIVFKTYADILPLIQPSASTGSVQVHAILEPLKVRLITKGSAPEMTYSKRHQKRTWTHLKHKRQFKLISRPLRVGDLHWLVGATKKARLPFGKFVSGDYKAATDNVKLPYTKMSNEASMEGAGYTDREKEIFRSVLYEQTVHYPDVEVDGKKQPAVPTVTQTTGQLMGSVLSFPHLCAINLVAYWSALEKYVGRSFQLHELPVLINGDDILFMTNDEFYTIWQQEIAKFGFLLSVGKNYVHEHYLMINSQSYWYDQGTFRPIGYLNVGLMSGQSKLTGREETRTSPIWDCYNKTLAGASNKLRAHVRFLELNKGMVEQFTRKGEFNLFIDRHFGGLGCHLYPEVESSVHFTGFQRKFGHFLRHSQSDYVGELSRMPSGIALLPTDGPAAKSLTKRHTGSYDLRPYTNVGNLANPSYQLIIDEEEELATSTMIAPAYLSEIRDPSRREYTIKFPEPSQLRRFRKFKGVLYTSIKPLLAQEWAVVKVPKRERPILPSKVPEMSTLMVEPIILSQDELDDLYAMIYEKELSDSKL